MTHSFIPAARERVRVRGRGGVFFVLAVDREEELAHLVSVDNREDGQEVETFPFGELAKLGVEEDNERNAGVA
jgi:hypothetical protein